MSRERRPSDYMEIFLEPGDFQFTTDPDVRFRTLLGSCVALTMWHPKRRYGAMCHYLLPTRGKDNRSDLDGRYGDEAYLMFLRECARHYTNPAHYEIKLFGGGDMFPAIDKARDMSIGQKNIAAGLALMDHLGMQFKARHVGGVGHRVVMLDVWDGAVWVKHQVPAPSPTPSRPRKKKVVHA
ncbi:MAG: chemotaxis protein CheD [Gammaproteobacteria bacterium]|nr:chemotaxis protein CheD [Gammaproteobacteria bacterium]